MTATRSHDEFTAVFRQEHREIRDVLLDLIDASRRDDLLEDRRLVRPLSSSASADELLRVDYCCG